MVQHLFNAESETMIATSLGISVHTVHSHFRRLYTKLGVHDRCELLLHIFAACCHACPQAARDGKCDVLPLN